MDFDEVERFVVLFLIPPELTSCIIDFDSRKMFRHTI